MERTKEILIITTSAIAAYFDTTISFVYALLLGFLFNILAGLRADQVTLRMVRFPLPSLLNYRGSKLKDSLTELALILLITYTIKSIVDLLHFDDKSTYAVQMLIAVAVYYYLRNGLRNLQQAYPRNRFITSVYHLVAFKFREIMPSVVSMAVSVEPEAEQPEGGEASSEHTNQRQDSHGRL